jgi:hypothetical protein
MTNSSKSKPLHSPSKKRLKRKTWLAQDFRTIIRTSVTLVICVFIFVHFLLALIFVLSPSEAMKNSQGINGIYKRYALPGPYFSDGTIISSPRFFIAEKKNNRWSSWRNPEQEDFNAYHQNYFRYDKLKKADFERHLARDFFRRVSKDSTTNFTDCNEFKSLDHYFRTEFITDNPDSIRIFYTLSKPKLRERKTKTDTVFLLTYKPW